VDSEVITLPDRQGGVLSSLQSEEGQRAALILVAMLPSQTAGTEVMSGPFV